MWYWDHLIWITADNTAELLQLENIPITDLARARIFKLYNS